MRGNGGSRKIIFTRFCQGRAAGEVAAEFDSAGEAEGE
jgi:hypothetical protein